MPIDITFIDTSHVIWQDTATVIFDTDANVFYETINESLNLNDSLVITTSGANIYSILVEESINLSDTLIVSGGGVNVYSILLEESIDLNDSQIISIVGYVGPIYEIINESVLFNDSIKWGWILKVIESLTMLDKADYILGLVCKEYLSLIDTQLNNWNGSDIVSDNLFTFDTAKLLKLYNDLLNDNLNCSDDIRAILTLIVLERLILADNNKANWTGIKNVSDSLKMVDTAKLLKLFNDLINDNLNCSDEIKAILILIVLERLIVIDSNNANWTGLKVLSDSLKMADASVIFKLYNDLLEDGINLAEFGAIGFKLFIVDNLYFNDSAQTIAQFKRQIYDAVKLSDAARIVWENLISEVFNLSVNTFAGKAALLNISENFNLTDEGFIKLFINKNVNDFIDLSSSINLLSILNVLIQETLSLQCFIEFEGEVYECWVLNTNQFHPSVYSNFNFNSYAYFMGKAYGCKKDGIYKLTGDKDNNTVFNTGVKLAKNDFKSNTSMRFRKAFLGIAGDNPALKMEVDGKSRVFKLIDGKASISRDLKGRKWAINISDFDQLDFMELIPVILARQQ